MTTKTICVVGGAGFVGSVLCPYLVNAGYNVRVFDKYIYGDTLRPRPGLTQIKGDVRDTAALPAVFSGCDAVIHLACISNDPSYELNPALAKSINFDSFAPLVDVAKDAGVKRFVYGSSSSVYGVKKEARVTENLALEPLTDYSKYKALCEDVLLQKRCHGFSTVILRPATISGYSPRFRMDVVVNTLTCQALATGEIKLLGGQQQRANLHLLDMAECYRMSLVWLDDYVDGQIYNIGNENHKLIDLAETIRAELGGRVKINVEPTNDPRSYSLCSDKIRQLGFVPQYTVRDAIKDLAAAYNSGHIVDPINNESYYNVKWLQKVGLE